MTDPRDDSLNRARAGASNAQASSIVVIGASAGGIAALQSLFTALPVPNGAAFVVLIHLDPDHRSELSAIIAAHTTMPVSEVGERERLLADHVYVIPPNRALELADGEICSVTFDAPRSHRSPVDHFLRSLAAQRGDSFAVILSGAGSDGTIGARALKEAGGMVLVQDPAEAEYDSMPRSAIATGVADFVLPVRDIAARLAELIWIKSDASAAMPAEVDEDVLQKILAQVLARTGHDFSGYKRSTVLRRIVRRMRIVRMADLAGYYDVMCENADEAQALFGDLSISVTTFFRDAEAFKAMAAIVLPALFDDGADNESIRVWVPGCATGEEAFSFAILLLEEAKRRGTRRPIQIFGTDSDSRALAFAREGRYPVSIAADVGEQRLLQFFVRDGDHYRVRQEVRDIVLFAAHDLLKDPPFSHVDLVSCRNVLIYLDRDLQEQVCNSFRFALKPAGLLFLGDSETADNPPGLFRCLDRGAMLYQSTAVIGEQPRLPGPLRPRDHGAPPVRAIGPTVTLGEAAMHRRALEQMAPPSILVDETRRVVHLSDHAGRFLEPAGGPLSGDAIDLVRPELRHELRSALGRALEQNLTTLSLPVTVRFNGAPHRVHLQVKPLREGDALRGAVVMFIDGDASVGGAEAKSGPSDAVTVRRLTQELELTQTRLRTLRAESDAANEEQRAANEELQSINEEYRSTSEELETNKEALQSINEDLQSVNAKLKLKLDTISRAHGDLQNLVAASDFVTVFLDPGLRIMRFTDPATGLFSITSVDQGRPITDFASQLEYDGLVKDARAVLADLAPVRREVRSRNGRWYDMRVRPYRTVDDKIEGVVITFIDISAQRQAEVRLRNTLGEMTHRIRNTLAAVQAIARHTFRGSRSVDEFFERFEARLASFASVHGLLAGANWQDVDLAEIVRLQLLPYVAEASGRLHVHGDPLALPADLAAPCGLVLQELAANAAKLGSLSVPAGSVNLRWTIAEEGADGTRRLAVIWQEHGGPLQPAEAGTSLIDGVIPGARIERQTTPEGLRCRIELPLPRPTVDGLV